MTACIAASIFVCSAAGLVAAYGMWGKDHMAMNQCVDAGDVFNEDWVTCDKTPPKNPEPRFLSAPVRLTLACSRAKQSDSHYETSC